MSGRPTSLRSMLLLRTPSASFEARRWRWCRSRAGGDFPTDLGSRTAKLRTRREARTGEADGIGVAFAAAMDRHPPGEARAGGRAAREFGCVALAATLLTAALTYPLAFRLGTMARVDNGDGQFSIWNVAWVARALIVD